MAEDGHVRDAQLVPREVAFAPGVELHKGLRDRVREVLLHPVPIAVDYELSRARASRNSREKAVAKNCEFTCEFEGARKLNRVHWGDHHRLADSVL